MRQVNNIERTDRHNEAMRCARGGASVLIVDDEDFIRRILSRIIMRQGYSVSEARDGLDALSKLAKRAYDAVVSDVSMPEMNGMELLSEVKRLYPETAVVLLTAYPGEYNLEVLQAAGADYCVTKPFRNAEIDKALRSLGLQGRSHG